jgi:hypothetical protein
MMAKIKEVLDGNKHYQWMFRCPGCDDWHGVDDSWKFNHDLDNPTFSPSVLVTRPPEDYRCHSFVREGKIEFLSDCTHELAGKTVELPELPEMKEGQDG